MRFIRKHETNIRRNPIKKEVIRRQLKVQPISDQVSEGLLRWFIHNSRM